MKAMLLTAGLGERMRPLTANVPKPALPVLGRPLVVQLLRWLSRLEPEHVVLNLHHLPEVLRGLLGEGGAGGLPPVRYSEEPRILGTAGALRKAAPWLRASGPIVVSNSDSLADTDLVAALASHRASGHLATLVLVAPPRPGYSVIDVDARGRVLALAGQPPVEPGRVASQGTFTGCHVLEESLLERIPDGGPSDIVRDVYRELAAEGRLGAYVHDGFWWEFGTPALYLAGSLALLDECRRRGARITEHDRIRMVGRAVVAWGAGAQVASDATFRGRGAVGFASQVGRGCSLEDSVIMPETWIGAGCRLVRSVVATGTELPEGYEAENALIVPQAGGSPLAMPLEPRP